MQAPLETAPVVIEQAETITLYDMATLINAVYQLTIEPTKDGRVPKRITKKLYPMLKGMERNYYVNEEDVYVDMLFDIMRALHLVKQVQPPVDTMKARYQVGERLPQWGTLTVSGQTHALLEHWQKDVRWEDVGELEVPSEIYDDEEDDVVFNNYRFASWDMAFNMDILAGRTTLLNHLRTYTPGQWYNLNTLLLDIWQNNPLGSRRPMSATMRKSEERKAQQSYQRWYRIYALDYVSMLSSSLHELGILDLGYKEDRNLHSLYTPTAFRITPLGSETLHRQPAGRGPGTHGEEDASARTLIVQPSFEVLLLQPDLPTLYSILPFTQVKQIGKASQLTLYQTSLHRGMAAGKTLEQIIQTLEKHSQKELPQNVLYTLQDWAKLYKETRLSMVMLIETPNEQIARRIAELEKFQHWNVRELAPCILALDGDANLQEVRNALEKTGVTIHLTGSFPKSSRSSDKSHNDRYY